MTYKSFLIFLGSFIITACGGGGGGHSSGSSTATDTSAMPATATISAPALPSNNAIVQQCPTVSAFSSASPPAPADGEIVGRITFDRVMFSNQLGQGLDYNNQREQPARGVVVEALGSSNGTACDGAAVATTLTDGDGWYRLTPPAGGKVCVRTRAQMYRASDNNSSTNWSIAVADNTAGNSLFVLSENAPASAGLRSRRDIHAVSGWSNGSYNAAREAAPFAILDTACKTLSAVITQRGATQFGQLTFFWSTKNTNDDNGTIEQGKIGGAFFNSNTVAIYLRGDASINTDEFDEMVIAHEFGHFVTHTISRSDSIGGEHSLLDYEDPRLAFDEGWATAFAGLALQNPIYRDSDEVATANSPSREFYFDIRTRFSAMDVPTGWFSESSMQRALYTLGADVTDGGSGMGLGLLLQTFSGSYKQTDALASIFSYGAQLKNDQPIYANAIASVLDLEQINGDAISKFAENETNASSISQFDLPVYALLDTLGSNTSKTVCSSNAYGTENTLSNRRYVHFVPPQTARYSFYVQPNSASGVAGFELLDRGQRLVYLQNSKAGTTLSANSGSMLQGGHNYVLSIFHVGNAVSKSAVPAGDQCFQVWAQTP